MSAKRRRVHSQRMIEESPDGATQLSPSAVPAALSAASSRSISGTILKLTLRHFMCHEHIEIEFNEHVTFVTGANGSGKSAALTGILVALGATARETDRGQKLKNLIQRGHQSCFVSVALRNTGNNSYRPEKYGHIITVDRTLNASGGGSYCIRACDGRVISRERRELNNILDRFNIQINNPVTILTQETSKNFLRIDDAQLKYKLFLRATCLEQIRRDYQQAHINLEVSEKRLLEKKQGLTDHRLIVDKLERQLDVHNNIDRLHEQLATLNKEIQWAKVREAESAALAANDEKLKHQQLIDKAADLRNKCHAQLMQKKQDKHALEARQDELNKQLQEKQMHHERILEQLTAVKKQLLAAENQYRSAVSSVAGCRQDRDNLQREIERVKNIDSAGVFEQQQQRAQQLQLLEQSIEQLAAQQHTRVTHGQHVAASVEECQRQMYQSRANLNAIKRKIAETDAELRRLQCVGAGALKTRGAVFGGWLLDVEQAVSTAVAEGRFLRAPLGPIGAYIKLKPGAEKWAPVVESCLSNVLTSFLVDNQQDMFVLKGIFSRVLANERRKPQIVCCRFLDKVHDVSRYGIDTRAGHLFSVWSVLHIDNAAVANAVIDLSSVENILLLENDQEARSLMSNRRRVPRGCSQALTLTGYQYYPDPKYRTYPIRVETRARYLQVSAEQAIRQMEEELNSAQVELASAEEARSATALQLQEHKNQLSDGEKQLQMTTKQLHCARHQLRQLQNEELPESPDLKTLEDEVAQLDRILDDAERSAVPLRQLEAQIKEKYEQLRQQADSCRQLSQKLLTEQLQPLTHELSQCTEHVGRLNHLLLRHADKQNQLTIRQKQLEEAAATAETSVRTLLQSTDGERLTVETSSVSLERQLTGLKRTISDGLASLSASGDREQLERQYCRAADELRCVSGQFDSLDAELTQMRQMLRVRDERLNNLRLALSQRMTHLFSVTLEARRYLGRMVCDHAAGKLYITVNPRRTEVCSEKTPQQLSGGERSFSTLCFILALWDVIECPFRMLDEFGVFMDEVNRKIGHDILLNSALSSNNQYVFLTPLSLPSATNNEQVSILRMYPPKR